MRYQWIESACQLQEMLTHLNLFSTLAIDTEFIKVNTFYPKLGVLQLNHQGQVYLLDGTLDLTLFWQKLFTCQQVVFHACGEDIDLIWHYSKQSLTHVFDTQLAMAFLGYGRQVSYQSALAQILNIHIEKDQTRSNWLARPLEPEQLDYAANDVYYLPQLALHLIDLLKKQQLYDYVLADCAIYCADIAKQLNIDALYLDHAHYRLNSRQLMQLKQLIIWRETLARQKNIPRSFILKNHSIQKIIQSQPKDKAMLAHIEDIDQGLIRHYGTTILNCLFHLPKKPHWPARLPAPYIYRSEQTNIAIQEHLVNISQTLNIPQEILWRKKWQAELALWQTKTTDDFSQLNPYLLGWRFEYLTLPILSILQQDR